MAVRHGTWVAALLAACLGCTGTLRAAPLTLAVVGDSDSHAYHDGTRFTGKDGQRGGAFHDTTWQWTEWLHRLRPSEVDQGPWGRYGSPRLVALLEEGLGRPARAPEKEDFAYNFAVSGAVCNDLMNVQKQVPRLVRLMDESPAAWRGGVVVLRIGVNSFGQRDSLERLAASSDAGVVGEIDRCIADVRDAVAYLHRHHPETRVVLVGIFDNAQVGENIHRWPSSRERANITRALDRYDNALKAMAAGDARIAFFDDRAWFAALWGHRTAEGGQAYRSVSLGGRFVVTNTQGDAPCHAILADGHAGTVWNALWAKALVHVLNQRFAAGIAPITPTEIASSAGASLRSGTATCVPS
jgi:hypothetical protein